MIVEGWCWFGEVDKMVKNWLCKCVSNVEVCDGRVWVLGEFVGCVEKDEYVVWCREWKVFYLMYDII